MKRIFVGLGAVVVALVMLVGSLGGIHPQSSGANGAVLASAAPSVMSPLRAWNASVPDADTTVSSYVQVSEPPILPPTTPVVVTLFQGPEPSGYMVGQFQAPRAPAGGWGLVELNFTTAVTGTLFDTDYNVWMNNVLVLFGTLPEYGQATVLKDITEYESALSGTVTWVLRHPHLCVTTCTFNSTLQISFYPAVGTPPAEPNEVLPVWNYTTLEPGHETASVDVTVPDDTVQAILEVYPYGYGADEFWYADEPQFRAVNISVAGTSLAYVLPFPYINTGGIDLFAWRPITADFTLNDRPDQLTLTPALGLIDGTNTWNVSITPSVTPGSYWHVTADLLIYTSHTVDGARLTSYGWTDFSVSTFTTPNCFDYVSPLCYYNQTATASYHYSSTLLPRGPTVSSSTVFSFTNGQLITPVWENVTGDEVTQTTTTSSGHGTHGTVVTTAAYPISLQTGFFITITGTDSYNCGTSSSPSPCPQGVAISLLNGLSQTYNLTVQASGSSTSYLNETTLVPISNWTGTLMFIAPTAAEITAIDFNDAVTTQVYTQYNWPTDPDFVYTHTVSGSDYINNATVANTTNDAEMITFNAAVRAPTLAYFLDALDSLSTQISGLSSAVQVLGDHSPSSTAYATISSGLAAASQTISVDWGLYNSSGLCDSTVPGDFQLDLEQVAVLEARLNSLETSGLPQTVGLTTPLLAALVGALATTTAYFVWRSRRRRNGRTRY